MLNARKENDIYDFSPPKVVSDILHHFENVF